MFCVHLFYTIRTFPQTIFTIINISLNIMCKYSIKPSREKEMTYDSFFVTRFDICLVAGIEHFI